MRARYAHVARGPRATDERWWNWAIVARGSPRRALGTVELSLRDGGARAHLAYMLGRATWGAGYAREACAAALGHLRDGAGRCDVEAFVDTRNVRSIALLERLHFSRKGFIANAAYFKASSSDEYAYELALREDDDAETSDR